jgi:hypothetical protein
MKPKLKGKAIPAGTSPAKRDSPLSGSYSNLDREPFGLDDGTAGKLVRIQIVGQLYRLSHAILALKLQSEKSR